MDKTNINFLEIYPYKEENNQMKEKGMNTNLNINRKKRISKKDEILNTNFFRLNIYNNRLNTDLYTINKNIINNKVNNNFYRNKNNFLLNNFNSIKNFSKKNNYDKTRNLTECSNISLKNKCLRNFFGNSSRINRNIFFIETKKYLLMDELRKKNENFILKTNYNPEKVYNIFKSNYNNFKTFNNKNIFKRNQILKKNNKIKKNNTFIYERNKNNFLKNKKYSKSLKTQIIKNIKLDIAFSKELPKMIISKNAFLNMHPINLRVFFK